MLSGRSSPDGTANSERVVEVAGIGKLLTPEAEGASLSVLRLAFTHTLPSPSWFVQRRALRRDVEAGSSPVAMDQAAWSRAASPAGVTSNAPAPSPGGSASSAGPSGATGKPSIGASGS